MNQNLSYLHPNPGWTQIKEEKSSSSKNDMQADIVGKHCILELYECDHEKLNDELYVRSVLISAAKVAGANLLNLKDD